MHFFMDELHIAACLENLPQKIAEFEKIAQTMDEVSSKPCLSLYCPYELHSLPFKDKSFAELLYSYYGDGEYRDAILLFDVAAQKGHSTDLENDRPLESGIIELARKGKGGCLSGTDYSAEEWWDDDAMCVVNDQPSLMVALRKLFVREGFQVDLLAQLSDLMFPDIYFHAGIGDVRKMDVSYREHGGLIIHQLAYLNDCAVDDFKNDLPAQVIQLAASRGVEISPESPNTHANVQAMGKRNIDINGVSLTCEWHTKVTYNKGRIHFHARPITHHESILRSTKSKLVVGIITDHLPT